MRDPLESLKDLRYQPRPGRWAELAQSTPARPARRRLAVVLALAAALLAAIVGGRLRAGAVPTLQAVVTAHGTLRETRLRTNGWLETGRDESATVKVANVGTVGVDPGSKLRLVRTGPEEHRLELERGSLRAVVSAPPRLFVVDTPHTTAVDLGCAYRLEVIDGDRTVLTVETGEVALEGSGRVSTVLAGMRAVSRSRAAPGTPYAVDAPAAFVAALERFDATGDGAALDTLLLEARPADAPTLWHLLPRADAPHREALSAKLAAFVPAPSDWSSGDAADPRSAAMQGWWNAVADQR